MTLMSAQPLSHTGPSVPLPSITRPWIFHNFPRPPTLRISRIWTETSSSDGSTLSRSTNHPSTLRHRRENPRPHWCAWSMTTSSHNCTTPIRLPHPSAHVTPQILRTLSPHGLRKIALYKRLSAILKLQAPYPVVQRGYIC